MCSQAKQQQNQDLDCLPRPKLSPASRMHPFSILLLADKLPLDSFVCFRVFLVMFICCYLPWLSCGCEKKNTLPKAPSGKKGSSFGLSVPPYSLMSISMGRHGGRSLGAGPNAPAARKQSVTSAHSQLASSFISNSGPGTREWCHPIAG